MRTLFIALIIPFFILVSGCLHYVPRVTQGQHWREDQAKKLHTGLSKKQVKYILGSPVLTSSEKQYDYVEYHTDSHGHITDLKRLSVLFNDQDQVCQILED